MEQIHHLDKVYCPVEAEHEDAKHGTSLWHPLFIMTALDTKQLSLYEVVLIQR